MLKLKGLMIQLIRKAPATEPPVIQASPVPRLRLTALLMSSPAP
jgi:hypothetical protein